MFRLIGEPIDLIVQGHFRENVGYIVEETRHGDREAVGTVFFVHVHMAHGLVFNYAVTCGHVVSGVSNRQFIRINKTAGGYEDLPIHFNQWTLNPVSDVAVVRVSADKSFRRWSYPMRFYRPGDAPVLSIGQDVFMAGLFASHPGQTSVEALVRSGKIALTLTQVSVEVNSRTKDRRTVVAHLVQALAWGGESGSPVFAYNPVHKLPTDAISRSLGETLEYGSPLTMEISVEERVEPHLVGMLHGHFRDMSEGVNAGIAIMIPYSKIVETLMDPVLTLERNAAVLQKEQEKQQNIKPLSSQ